MVIKIYMNIRTTIDFIRHVMGGRESKDKAESNSLELMTI
jgi:hypothetical protein